MRDTDRIRRIVFSVFLLVVAVWILEPAWRQGWQFHEERTQHGTTTYWEVPDGLCLTYDANDFAWGTCTGEGAANPPPIGTHPL